MRRAVSATASPPTRGAVGRNHPRDEGKSSLVKRASFAGTRALAALASMLMFARGSRDRTRGLVTPLASLLTPPPVAEIEYGGDGGWKTIIIN